MKIFTLDFDVNNYKSVQLCENVNADFYQMFDGTPVKNQWKTLEVKEYDDSKDYKTGDAPGAFIPMFNKKALDILLPIINDYIEILPFRFHDDCLYGINVLCLVDAIDYELSEYKTFRDGKRIMRFYKYAFIDDAIKDKEIFKITDLKRGDVFVSERFYNAVHENGLEGFDMKLVYDSEKKYEAINENKSAFCEVENKKDSDTRQIRGVKKHSEYPKCYGKDEACYRYVNELSKDKMQELIENEEFAYKAFGIPKTKDGERLARSISGVIDRFLEVGEYPMDYYGNNIAKLTTDIACLYGQAIILKYGWKWMAVGNQINQDDVFICVVSPDDKWINICDEYIKDIISRNNIGLGGENDNTVLLLFNMIGKVSNTSPEKKLTLLS